MLASDKDSRLSRFFRINGGAWFVSAASQEDSGSTQLRRKAVDVLIECLCLNCGLIYSLPERELVLDLYEGCDYPVATNIFCTQCNGVLGILDADTFSEEGPDDSEL